MDKPSFELNETDTFIFRNGETAKLESCGEGNFFSLDSGYFYHPDRCSKEAYFIFCWDKSERDIVGVKKMVDYSKPIFIGDDEVKIVWQDEKAAFGVIGERYVMIDKDDDGYRMIELDDCYNRPVTNKAIRWLVVKDLRKIVGQFEDRHNAIACKAMLGGRIMKVDISDESSYE